MKNLKTKINTKRLTAFVLSALLVMQQSLAYQVLASEITDANNNLIPGQNGVYNVRPDAVNGATGFKQFGKIDLSDGDVLNFIYNYLQQIEHVTWNGSAHDVDVETKMGDINTFIALVNQGVNINGIVNALQGVNGALKTNGNLMFITPAGFVVGASGVLNVGNLSVATPTKTSYDTLSNYLDLPKDAKYWAGTTEIIHDQSETEYEISRSDFDYGKNISVDTSKTFNISTLTDGNNNVLQIGTPEGVIGGVDYNKKIELNGRVLARGDINLKGGQIISGNNSKVYAGTKFETLDNNNYTDDAVSSNVEALFTALVNAGDVKQATEFANSNGNIVITSTVGTSTGAGSQVRNYASTGDIRINNQDGYNNTDLFNGIQIAGELTNRDGNMVLDQQNTAGKLAIANTGVVNSNNTSTSIDGSAGKEGLLVKNVGSQGMDIRGIVNVDHSQKANSVLFTNQNSNMTLGDTANVNTGANIISNADINIQVTAGDLLNNGVARNHIITSNNADLNVNVTNGKIGQDVTGCDGGVCTGIGRDARDLTKSINVKIPGTGKITATSTTGSRNESLVNMASLGTNMNVNHISADGKVILLADGEATKSQTSYDTNGQATGSVIKTTGTNRYDIVNRAEDASTPNVEGTGISIIASGKIGENTKALTFRQNGVSPIFNGDDATQPHVFNYTLPEQGVDMLAQEDINVKGLDAANGDKVNTKVCAIISREGKINAEFSGDTYVKETTSPTEINMLTRGKNLYVKNLGEAPDTYKEIAETSEDYYGEPAVSPAKAKLTALDLGSYWDVNEDPEYEHAADSTIVVENAKFHNNANEGRPSHQQDLTLVADNAYAGGYYFNMGKHRNIVNEDKANPKFEKTYYVEDERTNPIDGTIRAKAVRPDDIPEDATETRNFYYGGSTQGNDDGYDGVKDGDDYVEDPTPEQQGGENDDDNLVVPEPDDPEEPEIVVPLDDDDDTDNDTDTDLDTDTDNDTDTDIDNDTDLDNDNDADSDTDIDTDSDTDIDSDTDTDTDVDTDTDLDPDLDPDKDNTPIVDFGDFYKQTVKNDYVESIDKRQFMRFSAENNQNVISFESDNNVVAISDISRGGVSLKHNKSLKVGDIVPIHLKYGDVEVDANVKIVSTTDVKAGAKFIDLDPAAANKILYLSLLVKDEVIAQTVGNISTTSIDE